MSRTGRTSTSEPGRNARTFSMSTVKPPLTRPVMMPVTISPSLKACSRRVQVRARLAFSRDRRVSPVPSSTASSATSTSSPALTSSSPRSFLNWSIGTTASDFSPTLMMTTSGVDLDDEAHQDHARANPLVRQALFEHLAETFAHGLSRAPLEATRTVGRGRLRRRAGWLMIGFGLPQPCPALIYSATSTIRAAGRVARPVDDLGDTERRGIDHDRHLRPAPAARSGGTHPAGRAPRSRAKGRQG